MSSQGLERAFQIASLDGRVCPMPMPWDHVWKMLPDRRRAGTGWEPGLPLILAAWDTTPPLAKRQRFHEHLEWADARGVITEVADYLEGLQDSDWLMTDAS